MALVDVVVVSFNSADTLRDCVAPLAGGAELNVIIVDNASNDPSVESVSDLPVQVLALTRNGGFAYGCNRGWELGSAPYVLFLNPDARIDETGIRRLVSVLEGNRAAGLVAPLVVSEDGSVDHSQRRFPRLRSTYAQALFLHRIFKHAPWADEVIRDPEVYERAGVVDWVSGACVLLRRTALERLDGWDEGFFHYGEDIDICRRLWQSGLEVRYEPAATVVHVGGVSAPRAELRPQLAASRIRYATLHRSRTGARLERIGIALGELTHSLVSPKGGAMRAAHLRAFRRALLTTPTTSSQSGSTAVEDGLESN